MKVAMFFALAVLTANITVPAEAQHWRGSHGFPPRGHVHSFQHSFARPVFPAHAGFDFDGHRGFHPPFLERHFHHQFPEHHFRRHVRFVRHPSFAVSPPYFVPSYYDYGIPYEIPYGYGYYEDCDSCAFANIAYGTSALIGSTAYAYKAISGARNQGAGFITGQEYPQQNPGYYQQFPTNAGIQAQPDQEYQQQGFEEVPAQYQDQAPPSPGYSYTQYYSPSPAQSFSQVQAYQSQGYSTGSIYKQPAPSYHVYVVQPQPQLLQHPFPPPPSHYDCRLAAGLAKQAEIQGGRQIHTRVGSCPALVRIY